MKIIIAGLHEPVYNSSTFWLCHKRKHVGFIAGIARMAQSEIFTIMQGDALKDLNSYSLSARTRCALGR